MFGREIVVANEFLISLYIIAVGLAFAGGATYFYQWVWKQEAALRFDGANVFATAAHLMMSFVCGPFIMLNMGWRRDSAGGLHMSQALAFRFHCVWLELHHRSIRSLYLYRHFGTLIACSILLKVTCHKLRQMHLLLTVQT